MIQLTLTLKMTTAQVVETPVTVNNNSPIQDYVHQDDQTQPFEGPLNYQHCKRLTFFSSPVFKNHVYIINYYYYSILFYIFQGLKTVVICS